MGPTCKKHTTYLQQRYKWTCTTCYIVKNVHFWILEGLVEKKLFVTPSDTINTVLYFTFNLNPDSNLNYQLFHLVCYIKMFRNVSCDPDIIYPEELNSFGSLGHLPCCGWVGDPQPACAVIRIGLSAIGNVLDIILI